MTERLSLPKGVRTCAVALDIEASFLGAACFRGTDTGRIRTTARSRVYFFGCGNSNRRNRGDENEELHDDRTGWVEEVSRLRCE
jgi:hypothetical protein